MGRDSITFTGCVVALLAFAAGMAAADDWPQWGGPRRDIVWREKNIVRTLPTKGLLPRVWSTPIGEGYSGPAVANGRVYVMDRIRAAGNERVLCLDAADGNILWKHAWRAQYTVDYPAGPRMTPLVDGDRLYTIGTMGDMFCFQADSGKILWRKNFVDDFGTQIPTWGMVASPLVEGDQLITLVGGSNKGLVISFDKHTGKELWRALEDSEPGYCPPMLFTLGGTPQVIIWHPHAVSSLNPANGETYWEIPWPIKAGLCVPAPRQIGNRLFLTAFYNGPMMIEVGPGGKTAKIAWKGKSNSEQRTDGLHSIMPTPWVNEKNIYGVCSYGQLRCLDVQTGERQWETLAATGEGRWWNAFLIPHEDRFFIHNEQGDLIIAELSPAGYKELSRAKLVDPTRKVMDRMTIWSHPAFAMQSVFARNDKELVRVDLSAK
ncbi:MAG: PQQ-binding-like beta-propeller repeat protein [Planctomycetia bacterium]|nr:PQQ-binding-like beta-propeller repeat protein [Planctomycetia bacterium]